MNRQSAHLAFERLEERRLLAGDASMWGAGDIAVASDRIHEPASLEFVTPTRQSSQFNDGSLAPFLRDFPKSVSSSPLLWMQDNSLGHLGGLPSDFLQRFIDPEGWEHSLRAIDTLSLNEHAMIGRNGITNEVLSDTIAPVLNHNQVNISINSTAANFLSHRSRATGQTFEELLAGHFALLDRMVDAGLRVRTISINGPLTRVPGDLIARNQYPMSARIDDVVKYAELVRTRYPFIDVGIQDNLMDFGEDYQSIYRQLQNAMRSSGGDLDHIHYYRLVDLIGSDRAIGWLDVIQMQSFVQGELGSEFGLIASSSAAAESADQWRHDVIFNGIRPYLDLLTSSEGKTLRAPDRFIIAAWARYPDASYPEDRVKTDGTWKRLSTSTGAVRQASNLIRGYGDSRSGAMIDEIQQVQPIDAWAVSNQDQAKKVLFGASLVDATKVLENEQWFPVKSSGDQYWIKAELPRAVNLDRLRVWLSTDGDLRQRDVFIRIFTSDTGIGGVHGNEHWSAVGQAWVDGRQADSFVIPMAIKQKRFVGVRLFYGADQGPHEVRGLGAIRFYSPNNNWNGLSAGTKPKDPLPDSNRPVLAWQTPEVTWGDPGATIGKAIADGFDAAGKYELSVDDDRFDFFLSNLTLKRGIAIDEGEAPSVTVNVTLTDRDDLRRVFTYSFSFDVTSPLDSNGNLKDVFDYGDTSFYDRGSQQDSVARHRVGSLFLGDRVDPELAPQNDHLSRGDDMDTDGNDDDGVVFVGDIIAFETRLGSGTIRVKASGNGKLDAWIDFNGNQVFDHPEENLFGGQSVDVGVGYQLLDFSVPQGAVVDERTFSRFRISFDGGLRPYDDRPKAGDVIGEVEDYALRIHSGNVIDPQPPQITWQTYPVFSGVQGATAAKIFADGYDADGRYRLSVSDPRFEFERSFLRLQADQQIWKQDASTVTVRVALIDKADSARVFYQDIVIPIRGESTELFDYGDAPYRFGTTRFEDGPHHRLSELSLGRRVDTEADGQNQFQALGDDIDANGDDEDGVVLVSDLISRSIEGIGTIVVDSSDDALLDAWIDFNGNGRFDHPEEHLGQNRGGQSIAMNSGMNVIDFIVPANILPGTTYARYRLSSSGGLTPYGIADDGEVEDYCYQVKAASEGEAYSFTWPNLMLPSPSVMDVIITTDSQGVLISDSQRTLATFDASFLSIAGSHGNDRVRLPNSKLVTSNSTALRLGAGIDEVSFQSLVQLNLQDLPSGSLSGLDRLNLRGKAGDHISMSPESLMNATGSFDAIELLVDPGDLVVFTGRWDNSRLVLIDGVVTHQVVGLGSIVHLDNDRFWTHPLAPTDVNADGETTALDALRIINRLNREDEASFLPIRSVENLTEDFVDVTGDNEITALDALRVINFLNRQGSSVMAGEGQFIPTEAVPPTPNSQTNRQRIPDMPSLYEQSPKQSLTDFKQSRRPLETEDFRFVGTTSGGFRSVARLSEPISLAPNAFGSENRATIIVPTTLRGIRHADHRSGITELVARRPENPTERELAMLDNVFMELASDVIGTQLLLR